jgi:hypothetical protein
MNPHVAGGADQGLDPVEGVGGAATGAFIRFSPFVDHGKRKTQIGGDLFGAGLGQHGMEQFVGFHGRSLTNARHQRKW